MQYIYRFFPQGSIVLLATTALSYALGLLRDRIFAHTFGASRILDAYNAAFLFPDFLLNVFVASGIAAAFVPLFSELYRTDRSKALDYANTVLTAATGSMMVAAACIMVFAGPLSTLVAPGFRASEDRELVVQVLRILSVSPIIFAASNTFGAMLVARHRFLFYGLSPVFYNVGIIGGTLLFAPHWGIAGTALGTVLGALLHASIRIYDARRQGFSFRPNAKFLSPEFKKTLVLMLPKMFGHPVELATFWGFTAIASGLAPGSVAILNFARNFQSVPVSVIGIAVSTAAFPILTEAFTQRAHKRFHEVFTRSFWLIFIATSAGAVFVFTIRTPLITAVFGGDMFGTADILRTSAMLGMFTLAMPTESLVHILARAFYATKNTAIPVAISIAGLLVAVGLAWLLVPRFDILALPFAFFVASALKVVGLFGLLRARLRKF